MDGPRYRLLPRPSALNVRRKHWRRAWLALGIVGLFASVLFRLSDSKKAPHSKSATCDAPLEELPSQVAKLTPPVVTGLAQPRVEAAAVRIDQGRPAEALAWLVTALRAEPASVEARAMAAAILRDTIWHVPELEIRHPLPVSRLLIDGPSTLWVGFSGKASTVARWNPDVPAVEAVLFPVTQSALRSVVVDPTAQRLVVEREGVLLLCDARSLKPVADLGALPESVTPESTIVFSADGLLLAHPFANPEGAVGWRLRDAQTGQVLRQLDPAPVEDGVTIRPLTAMLDRSALKVLLEDGAVIEIPVSPVEPIAEHEPPEPVRFLHAQYAADGQALLVLVDRGPHQAPALEVRPDEAAAGLSGLLEETVARFSWHRQPGIWSGLLRDTARSPLHVGDRTVTLRGAAYAPIHASSRVTAVLRLGNRVLTGSDDGLVVRYRLLPRPSLRKSDFPADVAPDADAVEAFARLSAALAGVLHDDAQREPVRMDTAKRLASLTACDFTALARLFPELDFSAVTAAMAAIDPQMLGGDAMKPLNDRLARALDPGAVDPRVAAFGRALESSSPGEIAESLEALKDPPVLLRKLAESRIAELKGRPMEAIASWPEVFPDFGRMRLTEDWDGWEGVDFIHVIESFRQFVQAEMAKLEVPADATAEQRLDLFERLTDPETARALGRRRLAELCLKAAEDLASFADEAERRQVLATIAHQYGAFPARSLRALAHAHAALGQYDRAHGHWIALITEQPVATHEAADYAEAAYTAFETSDATQAMEILRTGIHRFPQDAEFALRAGWIALLTGHPDDAYLFLTGGEKAGYAPDKLERATVLLAIAAAQCGEVFAADDYFARLTESHPSWADPETIEELDWPEELKATLRQLTW